MAAPPQFIRKKTGNITIAVNNPAYAEWLKSAEGKQTTSEEYATGTVTGAAQTAMEETQRRAAEDRMAALSEVRAGKEEAIGEDFTGWRTALSEMGTGEYGEDIKEMMAAKAGIPIEAQTQQMIKDIQRSYYGGGFPGGMQQMMTQQAKLSKIGQLGGIRRDIEISSEEGRQRGLGIKEARMGELAKYRGGISTGVASKLAEILGHTITAVPKYGGVQELSPRATAMGTTTITTGGGARTAAPTTGARRGGLPTQPRFGEGLKRMEVRNGKFVQAGTW